MAGFSASGLDCFVIGSVGREEPDAGLCPGLWMMTSMSRSFIQFWIKTALPDYDKYAFILLSVRCSFVTLRVLFIHGLAAAYIIAAYNRSCSQSRLLSLIIGYLLICGQFFVGHPHTLD